MKKCKLRSGGGRSPPSTPPWIRHWASISKWGMGTLINSVRSQAVHCHDVGCISCIVHSSIMTLFSYIHLLRSDIFSRPLRLCKSLYRRLDVCAPGYFFPLRLCYLCLQLCSVSFVSAYSWDSCRASSSFFPFLCPLFSFPLQLRASEGVIYSYTYIQSYIHIYIHTHICALLLRWYCRAHRLTTGCEINITAILVTNLHVLGLFYLLISFCYFSVHCTVCR